MEKIWVTLLILWGGSGVLLLFPKQWLSRLHHKVGAILSFLGNMLGITVSIKVLLTGCAIEGSLPWSFPWGGELAFCIDPLSAFFLTIVFLVSTIVTLYTIGYLKPYSTHRSLSSFWFFYNLLVGSMVFITISKGVVCFLIGWEIMTLASFFLVMFEGEHTHVRYAGWIYFIASHIATACLWVLLIMIPKKQIISEPIQQLTITKVNLFDNDPTKEKINPDLSSNDQRNNLSSHRLFSMLPIVLLIVGFGTKAGLIPFHIWLPEAHPAAPSPVSAIMSGLMTKMGIYGIIRMVSLDFLQNKELLGYILIFLGLISGIFGILFALAQTDIKRLLAYSTVENVGIITIGIGLAVLGMQNGNLYLAWLGLGGTLFHVFNHAIFKSLLFLVAGGVIHCTGQRDLNSLGGLWKRYPWLAYPFFIGVLSICSVPFLNGFASKFLIYYAAFCGVTIPFNALVITGLAFIGGLTIVCFTQCLGISFLGEPRNPIQSSGHSLTWTMRIPLALLTTFCMIIGLGALWIFENVLQRIIVSLYPSISLSHEHFLIREPYRIILWCTGIFVIVGVVLWILRAFCIRTIHIAPTWDCGYIKPSPRMQYTASSFVSPVVRLFSPILRPKWKQRISTDLFPLSGQFSVEIKDIWDEYLFIPLFRKGTYFLQQLLCLQHGRLNLYITYILLALFILVIWKMR